MSGLVFSDSVGSAQSLSVESLTVSLKLSYHRQFRELPYTFGVVVHLAQSVCLLVSVYCACAASWFLDQRLPWGAEGDVGCGGLAGAVKLRAEGQPAFPSRVLSRVETSC